MSEMKSSNTKQPTKSPAAVPLSSAAASRTLTGAGSSFRRNMEKSNA